MLGFGTIAKKVFGTPNDRKVKAMRPMVEKVNALEAEIEKLRHICAIGSATFAQVYNTDGYNYILWNDQFYDNPMKTEGGPFGHAKGMAAWNDEGEGFVLQKLTGDGMAFVHAGGTLVEKELNDEAIYVDTGCLVGFTEGIDYDIELVKSLKGMLFGGEGLWMAALKGTGKVWIQSLPFARLADKILAQLPPPEVSDS